MIHHKRARLAAAIALATVMTDVAAEDFEVVASIDSVTVFEFGAEVTRVGSLTIPAGEHRLLIAGLHPDIEPERLQLSLGSAEIRLGTLQLEEEFDSELVNDEEQRLQAELDALLFDRQAIADEIASANTQLKLLDSVASGALVGDQGSLAVAEITALLDTLSDASNRARQVIRDANQRLQAQDKAIVQKRAELAQVATQQRSQQRLTVSVTSEAETNSEVSITYPVEEAWWDWVYEARLDTESRALEIQRKVAVEQASGEDWSDVRLNITTADPDANTATPQLDSLLVDLYQPQPMALSRARQESFSDLEEVIVTGDFTRRAANASFAQEVASQYVVDFRIPGTVSIGADSQPQILPIDQRRVAVDLVTRVVPEADDSAYLEARFVQEGTTPLQAGEMQFYRDGAFIGSRYVSSFLPEEEISLPFGKDERVRVQTVTEEQQSREGGTFRRNAIEDHRVSYLLTSFHDQAIDLELLARIPVSQNQAIEVEVADDATPFDEVDVEEQTGIVLWKRRAEPTDTIEIRHFYSVAFPRDERLDYNGR